MEEGGAGVGPELSLGPDVTGRRPLHSDGGHPLALGPGPEFGTGAAPRRQRPGGPVEGPLLSASLDQPSGITSDGKVLYFADSEASAIRSADDGRVSTVVGLDLFVFGDVDGTGEAVRLQHPLGIQFHDGVLYLADTYNNKIKKVLPLTRGVLTFLGTGEAGHRDGEGGQALFHEPGDVSVAAGKVYIADTNNHAIRVADLDTGQVSTLELRGL